MRETEIESLFDVYRNELGESHRGPCDRSSARVPWRLATGIAAVLLVGGVILWPRNAAAKAEGNMMAAITNAHTMELHYSMQLPSGKWLPFLHACYRDGNWWRSIYKGRGFQQTSIIKGGEMLTDFERLDHATLHPATVEEDWMQSPCTALDFIVHLISSAPSTDPDTRLNVVPHDPVKGRAAFVLRITNANSGYIGDILVDRDTDLPIHADIQIGLGVTKLRYRLDCDFSGAFSDGLFSLERKKPVLDLVKAKQNLAREWSKPIAKVGEIVVLSASQSENGTIWIVSGEPENASVGSLPTTLSVGGESFVRMRDAMPTSAVQDQEPLILNGEYLTLSSFVPLAESYRSDTKATVGFAQRSTDEPIKIAGPVREIHLPIQQEPGDRPSYLGALGLDRYSISARMDEWMTRADELRKMKRYSAAARAYEEASHQRGLLVIHAAAGPLHKAAECHSLAGEGSAEARDLAIAARLEAEGER